jgi:hypothetical protein
VAWKRAGESPVVCGLGTRSGLWMGVEQRRQRAHGHRRGRDSCRDPDIENWSAKKAP